MSNIMLQICTFDSFDRLNKNWEEEEEEEN